MNCKLTSYKCYSKRRKEGDNFWQRCCWQGAGWMGTNFTKCSIMNIENISICRCVCMCIYCLTQFWSPKVGHQVIGKIVLALKPVVLPYLCLAEMVASSSWYSSLISAELKSLSLLSHGILPLCVSVSTWHFPLLIWHQSYWIKTCPSDLILMWQYVQRSYFQIR